jgi:hypothetical protein
MKYFSLLFLCIVLSAAGKSQGKEYLYYFDSDLKMADSAHAVFYGTGGMDGDRLRLMLYDMKDKHLIMIQHFMDSSLQVSDGIFTSYYGGTAKESEGEYTNGQQDGWWQWWDTTGNIIDSTLYDRGQLSFKKTFTYFPKITQVSISDLKNHASSNLLYDEKGNLIPVDTTRVSNPDIIFTKEEIEPAFPGGEEAFKLYLDKKIKDQVSESHYSGKCVIRFIVYSSGEVASVQAISGNNELSSIVVNAIKDGPKWLPGLQNGHYINAYKVITITYP